MKISAIETERLILRSFTEQDVDAILRIFGNENINAYLPWFPLKTLEEAKVFYEENYANTKDYKYAICLKSDNTPIGYIHVSMDESHDFGYGLLEEYWRQGILSEAGRAIIEQVRNDGLAYISATHDIKNPHSGYVMKSLGMKYQYTYEELWQPKNFLVNFRMYQLNFDGSDDVYKKYWDMYNVHYIETDV